VTAAILSRNLDLATEEKSSIEDSQRALRQSREASHQEWDPKFFLMKDDQWILKVKECVSSVLGAVWSVPCHSFHFVFCLGYSKDRWT
jgi:hypothetical protein